MAENQDLSDLINALDAYQENQETLPSVVEAAFNLFGEDWTAVLSSKIDELTDVSPERKQLIKDKADHALHYYGALGAWQEAYEYLNNPSNYSAAEISDRIPVLEYWLTLFGDDGQRLLNDVRKLIVSDSTSSEAAQETETPDLPKEENIQPNEPKEENTTLIEETEITSDAVEVPILEESILQPENETLPKDEVISGDGAQPEEADILKEEMPETDDAPVLSDFSDIEQPIEPQEEIEQTSDFVEQAQDTNNTSATDEQNEINSMEYADSLFQQSEDIMPKPIDAEKDRFSYRFEILQYLNEKQLYENAINWLSSYYFRRNKNAERTDYKYFGFIVDLMVDLKNNIQDMLSNPLLDEYMEIQLDTGRKGVEDFLTSLQKELDGLPDEWRPTEDEEDINLHDVLGDIDNTTNKEYIGPAPDGFELMENPYEVAPEKIIEEFEKTEKETQEKTVEQQ